MRSLPARSIPPPFVLRSRSQGETSAEAEQNIVNQLQSRPLGKAITADDVAELVVWLLGPHSAKITGSINVIDGGVCT